jgi:ADP-heptose:LPS heptosyltransferase
MRLVALIPGGIGDQILFFATLDDLKRYYPHMQIDVVVEPRAKAAYRVSKSVHEVFTFDYKDRNSLADWGNLVGTIRDREYDVAITLEQSWFVGLLLWLTGIPMRIGYQGRNAAFLTHIISLRKNEYLAEVYHDLIQPLNINTVCPELTVAILKQDIEWAQQEQKHLGVHETGYILINGSYGDSSTTSTGGFTYPVESWQQIIRECQQKQPNLPIVAIKTAGDDQFISSLLSVTSQIKVTSPSDIGKLTAIIGGASLMLSIDNGALQLSVAVQTYTIALFGPTDPAKVLPKNEKFLAIKSTTGKTQDILPEKVLAKIWGG